MSPYRPQILLTLASLLVLASCVEASSLSPVPSPPSVDIDVPGDSGGGGGCWYSGVEDSDNDGIPDITEDANRNCYVDPDETDPRIADSDGDGLIDGDEDVDANGVWDAHRGELNPLMFDSDGGDVSDGVKPRAKVCNRAHFNALKGERLILGSGLTLFAHADISWVEPAGERAVYVRGENWADIGAIFDVSTTQLSMDDALEAMKGVLVSNTSIDLLGRRWMASVGQEAVQLRVESAHAFRTLFPALLQSIDETVVGFEPQGIPQEELVDGPIVLQIIRLDSDGKVRISIAASMENSEGEWLNIVHPRLMAPDSSHMIRLYCEDVESVETRNLDVFVMLEEGVDPSRIQIWDSVLRYIVVARSFGGLQTRLFVPGESNDGPWRVWDISEGLDAGWMSELQPLSAQTMFASTAPYLANLSAATNATDAQLLLMITGSGEEVGRVPSSGDRNVLGDLPYLSKVLVAPSPAPFGCSENATDERFESIQNFARDSDAYLISSCGFQGQYESARKILSPFVEHMWIGGDNRPLWHTLRLATEDGAVDAEFTMLGGQQVVVSRGAARFEKAAISYGVWEPSLVSAIRPRE